MKKRISHKELTKWLVYRKTSGAFFWRKRAYKKHLVGSRAGYLAKNKWRIHAAGRMYEANQLAWFYVTKKWPAFEVDHINRNSSDDRWKNLREATVSQNRQNRAKAKNQKSRFIGVTRTHTKWRAYVTLCKNGKSFQKHIGVFLSESDAAQARDRVIRNRKFTWRPLNFGRGHRALSRQ